MVNLSIYLYYSTYLLSYIPFPEIVILLNNFKITYVCMLSKQLGKNKPYK